MHLSDELMEEFLFWKEKEYEYEDKVNTARFCVELYSSILSQVESGESDPEKWNYDV